MEPKPPTRWTDADDEKFRQWWEAKWEANDAPPPAPTIWQRLWDWLGR